MITKLFILMMALYIGPGEFEIQKLDVYVSAEVCDEQARSAVESYAKYAEEHNRPTAAFRCVPVDVPESY